MGRAATAVGAIAIVLGGAAIGYAVTRKASPGMRPEQHEAMRAALAQLKSDIDVAQATIHERASTLSQQRFVHSAVATDARTVADQVGRELSFVPAAGEIIELGQIDLTRPKVTTLLRVPDGGMQIGHGGAPGRYAEVDGDRLVIIEVVKVEPVSQQGTTAPQAGSGEPPHEYMGFLAVSRPIETRSKLQPLVDAGIAGKLVINGKSLAIGAPARDAALEPHPIDLPGAQLLVTASEATALMPLPILLGGVAAALVGLVFLFISVTAKRDGRTTAFQSMATVPTTPPQITGIAHAETQFSQSFAAAGTPFSGPGPDPGRSGIVPSNLGAGAMIGRWEVVRRLGSGGMADVYLAQARGDGGFEKLVAIKVMHSHLARTQRAVDHFLDEARLAARIHHPNVVAIQDLGKIGEDYVIVMEYVDGVDLERLLTSARTGERPVPLGVGLGILCRICDGLDAAHRATSPDGSPLNIVHRDVKSANILVSRQGTVKVVDFGIAKAANQVHYTAIGETKGTPAMMAPEQRVGEQVDIRADVYSAAAVGFEIVTGHAVNLDLAALAHLGVDNWPHLPLPSSLRTNLPTELDEILLGAMAFDREKRPADCASLEALCEAVMKTHNLAASDKDIARWVESELRFLGPAYGGPALSVSRSPAV